MHEPLTLSQLREHFPAWSRVRRELSRGTVADVGVVRGCGVVYVSWDPAARDAARLEAVVASALRRIEQQ